MFEAAFSQVVAQLPDPASPAGLAAIGCLLAAAAVGTRAVTHAGRYRERCRRGQDEGKALQLVRAIRAALVAGALIGCGVGLAFEIDWLVVLALVIGAEELLEGSVVVAALSDEQRQRDLQAARVASST